MIRRPRRVVQREALEVLQANDSLLPDDWQPHQVDPCRLPFPTLARLLTRLVG